VVDFHGSRPNPVLT